MAKTSSYQIDVQLLYDLYPKYRRKTIYYKIRRDLIEIFRNQCQYKGEEIIEGI